MYKEGVQLIVQSKSKTFFSFCFCFLLGILFSSLFENLLLSVKFLFIYYFLFLCVALVLFFWEKKTYRFFLLCIFFFFLAISRYVFIFPNDMDIVHFSGSEKTFQGFVSEEPDIREDGVRYVLTVIPNSEDEKNKMTGKVYLKNTLYPEYRYGEMLHVTCTLERPGIIDTFRYDKYLEKSGIFTLCLFPQIHALPSEKGNFFLKRVLSLKALVAKKVERLWHEPYSSFIAGVLYGYRGGLGVLAEDFNRTGVTHIIAISGYNITLVASFLVTFLTYLYIPRKKAFYIVMVAIMCFTFFAGASASVVRAAIMGILVLFSQQVGRLSHSGNALIFAAAVMCLHNPLVLLWDAGFQLSFLATLGLVYINPLFQEKFQNIPDFFGLRDICIGTCSATLMTLPLIMYQFGRVSLVSLVVNILVLPVIPFIMYVGFMVIVLSFIFPFLSIFLSFVARGAMEYVIQIVQMFSHFSFASLEISIPIWLLTFVYGELFFFLYTYRKKNRWRLND